MSAVVAAAEGTRLAELETCAAVDEDAERLACFDELVERTRKSATARDSAGASARGSEDDFGSDTLDRASAEPRENVDSLTARVERVEQRPHGQYVFHLSNGQVWTELSAGRRRYGAGVDVTIERTALGGYMLSTGVGRATRVRRVE